MDNSPSLVRVSKFLSLVLRHQPDRIGLRLDDAGWADVSELLEKARQADLPLTRELLVEVVEKNDKKRFALSDDGRSIRASQGHSIAVDLGLAPVSPPEHLYHGTARHHLDSIRRQGLVAGRRNHVHLSGDTQTAMTVGRRHGQPVVLTVAAGRTERDGHVFYRSANGVWLTETVPLPYLEEPALPDA
jgi:putative RNA 2'-phosphotransferase